MKKTIYLFVVIIFTLTSLVSVYASDLVAQLVDINEVEQYNFSDEVTDMIKTKIEDGGNVYYGEGVTDPDYLDDNVNAKAIPTDVIYLPENGTIFGNNMEYGNVYYSPFLFEATEPCKMKIHRTCTINYEPCYVNLQVVDKTTDRIIFNNDLYVNVNGYTLSVQLTETHQYYLIVTPLDEGDSYASFYVYGEPEATVRGAN